MMLRHLRMVAAILAATLVLSMPATAQAGTYQNSYNGSESATETTTLNYSSHRAFNLRVRITRSGIPQFGVSTQYTIKMYDSSGRQVWSASNQGDRTYSIGSNVRKIRISPKTPWFTLTTRWERR